MVSGAKFGRFLEKGNFWVFKQLWADVLPKPPTYGGHPIIVLGRYWFGIVFFW